MIGFAISDTTTAIRIYARTLLNIQHIPPVKAIPAASRIYFASFSVYLTLFSIYSAVRYYCRDFFWTVNEGVRLVCSKFFACAESPCHADGLDSCSKTGLHVNV